MTPQHSRLATLGSRVRIHPDVAGALDAGQAIVALESTILTHGMPYPRNYDMATSVEAIIRDEAAVPATVAVVDGVLRIGLDSGELEALSRVGDPRKLSRADLAYAIARGETGGTTVAATMMAAALVGVDVFATGGIGGVHRGAEHTFDESADLAELGRTDVVVVSAGAKAILDIPKTLERLESLGVPVVAVGTDVMPAFWSRTSPLPAPLRLDTPQEIAQFERARRALGVTSGMLVANPIPPDAEIPEGEMATVITRAQQDAEAVGIVGKETTPYLLQRVLDLTDGRSLESNIALVESNARLAARIAQALAEPPT